MNKSLLTNLVGIALILLGKCLDFAWAPHLFYTGIFAFSGSITNWLAVHMLFEKIPYIYGSGVIPSRFEEFKDGIKSLIMNQFFTEDNIKKFLENTFKQPEQALSNVENFLDEMDLNQLFDKLLEVVTASPLGGMLAMFGGAEALAPLRGPFLEKIKIGLSDLLSDPKFQQALKQKLSAGGGQVQGKIEHMIDSRLSELTPQMVKEIIQEMIHKHLGWLVVWGGIFGGLLGLISSFLGL